MAAVWVASLLAGSFDVGRIFGSIRADVRVVVLPLLIGLTVLWVATCPTKLRGAANVATPLLVTAWCAWTAASVLWAPDFGQRLTVALDVVALLAVVWVSWTLVTVGGPRMAWHFWGWLAAASIVYLLLALWAGPGVQGRFSVPGGGPNVFVRVMVLGAMGLGLWALRGPRWRIFVLAVPGLMLGAVLSGSRGGLLAAGVAASVLAVPIVRRGKGLLVGLAIPTVLVVSVAFLLLSGQVTELERLLLDRYWTQTFEEGYSSGRTEIWSDAMTMFAQHPVVGVGASGYEYLQTTLVRYSYPHNLLLTVACEGGLVGLLLLSAALLSLIPAIRSVWRRDDNLGWVTLAGLAFMVTASMFSGYYYDTRILWVMAIILCQLEVSRPPGRRSVHGPAPSAQVNRERIPRRNG